MEGGVIPVRRGSSSHRRLNQWQDISKGWTPRTCGKFRRSPSCIMKGRPGPIGKGRKIMTSAKTMPRSWRRLKAILLTQFSIWVVGRAGHCQSKILNTSREQRGAYLDPQKLRKINWHKFWIRSSGKVIDFTLTTPFPEFHGGTLAVPHAPTSSRPCTSVTNGEGLCTEYIICSSAFARVKPT